MLSAAARGLRNPQQAGGPQFMTREELVGCIRVLSDTARRRGHHIRLPALRRRKETEQEERGGVISRGNVQVGRYPLLVPSLLCLVSAGRPLLASMCGFVAGGVIRMGVTAHLHL